MFFGCRDYIDSQRPDVFILENVTGLDKLEGGRVIDMFLDLLRFIGGGAYVVAKFCLNSEDFGVPHHRVRVYIVGRLRHLVKEPMRIRVAGKEDIEAFLDPLSMKQPPETKQLTAIERRNLVSVIKALRAKGADSGETRISWSMWTPQKSIEVFVRTLAHVCLRRVPKDSGSHLGIGV